VLSRQLLIPLNSSKDDNSFVIIFLFLKFEIFVLFLLPTVKKIVYSEFFLRLAIGIYMLIFQPPVNFCSDENIQTIFGTKLEDFSNYRIDYNSISQTVEKVVKKIFFSAPKASKSGNRQVLVEPTMALLWRSLDVLLFRRPENFFSQLFRQFGILNCNLSDSSKNLPT
jgi:hypothetical protein